MKRQLFLILTAVLTFNCYSQITFQNGYFINNSNQKIECLIKNIQWKNNPTDFDYKISENSNSENITIKSVKEFVIYDSSKYVRSLVNIDRSTEFINNLTYEGNPIFTEEELFLKPIVEGEANLYLYVEGNLKRYFYNKENTNIEQLVFKKYLNSDYAVTLNNKYKQQLLSDLNCPSFKASKIAYLEYKEKQLVNYFIDYNKCDNKEYKSPVKNKKKNFFNLNVRPGVNSSSLSAENSISNNRDVDFDNELSFRLGLEAEFTLPFNTNKWSVIAEPSYQYYKSETKLPTQNVKADYKSIELGFGVRHYLFLNENSKLFLNGSLVVGFAMNSKIDYARTDPSNVDLNITSGSNLAFGVGYKQNNKYSIELRYLTKRQLLNDYAAWTSDYQTVSLIFGYSIF
jgi:hypothetical protein